MPFILSAFGSTLLVESEENPANLLNYVDIYRAVAIVPRFFMKGSADNVLSEARVASEKVNLLQYQLK